MNKIFTTFNESTEIFKEIYENYIPSQNDSFFVFLNENFYFNLIETNFSFSELSEIDSILNQSQENEKKNIQKNNKTKIMQFSVLFSLGTHYFTLIRGNLYKYFLQF